MKAAQQAFVPALFGHGDEDDFILPSHTLALQEAYAGDSNKVIFGGDHNSPRPPFFHSSVSIFVRNHLLVAADFGAENPLPNNATVDEFFSSIGGGDNMNVFPRLASRGRGVGGGDSDDSYSSESYPYAPSMSVVGGSARNAAAVTEEDLVQQAIALSLAETAKEIEADPDLALALAMSAAEAPSPELGNSPSMSNGDGDSNSEGNVSRADSRRPGARSAPVNDAPIAAKEPPSGSTKVKNSKDKDKSSKDKDKSDKKSKKSKSSSKDPQSSASPSTSPNPLKASVGEDNDLPTIVSPRTGKEKEKKSKHKSPASTSSPPLSPLASPKKHVPEDKKSSSSPPRSPNARSKRAHQQAEEPAVTLDFSDEESMDEDMKLAIALSQQPQTPPRSKKK